MSATDGLFGPGIFATGIDVSALDEGTALKLGIFFGEQIREAERRGWLMAAAALRDQAVKDWNDEDLPEVISFARAMAWAEGAQWLDEHASTKENR